MRPGRTVVRYAVVIAFMVAAVVGGCEGNAPDTRCDTYSEADDPAGVSDQAWAEVGPGIHVAVGSLDEHYFRSEVPDLPRTLQWKRAAWRGEKVSAQIVTWAADSLRRLVCR